MSKPWVPPPGPAPLRSLPPPPLPSLLLLPAPPPASPTHRQSSAHAAARVDPGSSLRASNHSASPLDPCTAPPGTCGGHEQAA